MTFQPTLISSYSGLIKDKKPFLLIDEAFQTLQNAYTWRETVKKREGIQLVGRLRRCFTVAVTLSVQATGSSHTVTDILDDSAFDLRSPASPAISETNAEIEPGGVTIVVGGLSFTDSASNGVLSEAGASTGTINYVTGELNLAFSPAIGNTNVDVTFCYFPALPAMGISNRELAAVNVEQSVFFDQKYVYSYSDTTNLFTSPSTTTWTGTDAQFFWTSNYRGNTADVRLFFATNNAAPSASTNNRIRHTTDLANWTTFDPAVGGTQEANEGVGTLVTPFSSFSGSLNFTSVIPGSVTITVSNGVDNTVGFRDAVGTYPAGVLRGSPSTNSGTIDYSTGAITLTISPVFTQNGTITATYQHETTFLFQAKIIVPYYGRLLFLNTFEGINANLATNIYNRCRATQIGNPIERGAMISTIPGRGIFLDIPINEAIVSAQFYKNTLIVFCERSTWQLRYVGEVGLPFLWERISSDFGSESTFSTVLFDKGILAVGDKAIVSSSGNDVDRIDLSIPDQVFEFNNENSGKERVHGVRNFQKEVVYWSYSDGGLQTKFPNRVLLFNYRNGTFAIFRDNVTVFGQLASPNGISWDEETPWDSKTSWDTTFPAEFLMTISGNQQGFIHWYQDPDTESNVDSVTNMNEQESLAITGIILSATANIIITVVDHNLEQNEIIFITGLLFVNETTDTAVTTSLNGQFYQVSAISGSDNTISLTRWNFTTQQYETTSHNNLGYTPDPADSDTYMGGGQVTLIQNIDIITKDFNPFVAQGSHIKMSYTDFMTDATPNASISVNLFVNSSFAARGNLIVGNTQVETAIRQFGRISDITQANPAQVTSANHGLRTNQVITIRDVVGMTQVNSGLFTITFVDEDNFTLGVDSLLFTTYVSGGEWLTQDNRFYVPGSNYAWHRFYATCFGQYLSYQLFYDDNLMNTIDTHQTGFQMNAMMLWLRQGGRLVL